jgi:hypothetical protein
MSQSVVSQLSTNDRFFLIGMAAGLAPGLLAVFDAMTGQHFYLFRIFVWTLALPGIRMGYVHDAETFWLTLGITAPLFVLPLMLGGIGFMFRALPNPIAFVAERWIGLCGGIMLLQVIFYCLLGMYTLLTQ